MTFLLKRFSQGSSSFSSLYTRWSVLSHCSGMYPFTNGNDLEMEYGSHLRKLRDLVVVQQIKIDKQSFNAYIYLYIFKV